MTRGGRRRRLGDGKSGKWSPESYDGEGKGVMVGEGDGGGGAGREIAGEGGAGGRADGASASLFHAITGVR